MNLRQLFDALSLLPGHENAKLEDFRIVQELYDPGCPSEVHFYLTGPDTFYLFLTQIEHGRETTLAEYTKEVLDEADMRKEA